MKTYDPKHLKLWTRPNCYFGESWPATYSSGVGQSRDSDALERANFKSMLDSIGGESETVTVVRESHWAVGWVEWIAIQQDDGDALEKADSQVARLENYPILDEELHSQIEDDDCSETWRNCYDEKERAEYLRKHVGKVYPFPGESAYSMLRKAIKGDWGYAANLLPCPSDLIY